MVTPDEALTAYVSALTSVGADLFSYHFKFANNRVCIGHGREGDWIQWGMTWYTPEELVKLAEMRRRDIPRAIKVRNRFVEVDRKRT